eukprot:UC4_evm3s205
MSQDKLEQQCSDNDVSRLPKHEDQTEGSSAFKGLCMCWGIIKIICYMCYKTIFCLKSEPPRPEYEILCLGLTGAGKSAILTAINDEHPEDTSSSSGFSGIPSPLPTNGFAVKAVQLPRHILNIKEIGGSEKFRPHWHRYYESHLLEGLLYIIDNGLAQEIDREIQLQQVDLACAEFANVVAGLQNDIPVGVLLNKNDLEPLITPEKIEEKIKKACQKQSFFPSRFIGDLPVQYHHNCRGHMIYDKAVELYLSFCNGPTVVRQLVHMFCPEKWRGGQNTKAEMPSEFVFMHLVDGRSDTHWHDRPGAMLVVGVNVDGAALGVMVLKVGVVVGFEVGSFVGSPVGESGSLVGAAEGANNVGVDVGACDGDFEGLSEGFGIDAVGVEVGGSVGIEGVSVGYFEGSEDGLILGDLVEGEAVGVREGDIDGESVDGDVVGFDDGGFVGDKVVGMKVGLRKVGSAEAFLASLGRIFHETSGLFFNADPCTIAV